MIQQMRWEELQKRRNVLSLTHPSRQRLENGQEEPSTPLHVVYVMTQVGVSGGAKVIFQHAKYLQQSGVRVTLVSHFIRPDWFPITCDYIQVPFGAELAHGIPLCDVIVATYWDHIHACITTGIAPVVYFEQGDAHLFQPNELTPEMREFAYRQMQLPEYIITVSEGASQALLEHYGRTSEIFTNALESEIFHPDGPRYDNGAPYVLMIGGDTTKFKGLRGITVAFAEVKEKYPGVELVWVSPKEPTQYYYGVDKFIVNPSQNELAQIYRGAALFVSGSQYESFSLPVLEAMSVGCPVVTTRNRGVLDYAVDEYNVVFSDSDPNELALQMERVLQSEELRVKLIENGLTTSRNYNWSSIIPGLANFYKQVAQYKPQVVNEDTVWDVFVSPEQFGKPEDYEKFVCLLQQTKANQVRLPVVYSLLPNLEIARWETAAVKQNNLSELTSSDFFLKVNGQDISNLPYANAYFYFTRGDYQTALNSFVRKINETSDEKEKLTYLRWSILCLLELSNEKKALELLEGTLAKIQDNSDLYYLSILLAAWSKQEVEDVVEYKNMIQTLGDAAHYPEFFNNINLKL